MRLALLTLVFVCSCGWQDLNPSLRMAESDAVAAWSAATGFPIATPRITVAACDNGPLPTGYLEVACADVERYGLTISPVLLQPRVRAQIDLRTILLHEMGHLFGVPHIPGDPLMAPEPLTHLSRPSRAALAAIRNPE
jgi:hypothetical protein